MEKWQTDALTQNLPCIVKRLDQIQDLLDMLCAEKILAVTTVDAIRLEKCRREQARKIVDHIKRRPSRDFDKFILCLNLTMNTDIAELLMPSGYSASHPELHPQQQHNPDISMESGDGDYVLPKVWPHEDLLKSDVYVVPVKCSQMQSRYNRHVSGSAGSDYCMASEPRGRAIIISNVNFSNPLRPRDGNAADLLRVTNLLEQLQFVVITFADFPKDKLMRSLVDEQNPGGNSYSCLIVVILTHGKKGGIMTVDDEFIEFEEILINFDATKCDAYANKPKIFLVQACQGTERDNGEFPKENITTLTEQFSGVQITQADALVINEKTPLFADMLIAVATVPGFVSWRNSLLGTWFIQAVVEVFSKCACSDNIHSMLVKVKRLVSKGQTRNAKNIQISNVAFDTLRYEVYFFPGCKKPMIHVTQVV